MTTRELETDAELMLAEMRRALSPTQADAARVLVATQRALRMESEIAGGNATRASSPVPGIERSARWKWLAVLTGTAVLLGALMIILQRERMDSLRPAATIPPSPSASRADADAPAPPQRTIEPADPGAGSASAVGPAGRAAGTSSSSAAEQPVPRGKPRQARELPGERVAEPDTGPVLDSLSLELRALRRVETALRAGQPQRALSILEELDRSVPGGGLREERLAASVVARCAIDAGSRPTLLREFTRDNPASVYLARVEQSCSPRAAGAPDGSHR